MQLRQILNLKLSFELAKYEGIKYDIAKLSTILYDNLPCQMQKCFQTEAIECNNNAELIEVCIIFCNSFIGGYNGKF